ncbi:MAG: hypothetical protein ACHQQS_12225 [Thermoanaerobaculales bacterium]
MKRALVVSGGIFQVESALGALASAGFEAVAAESLAELRAQVEAGTVAAVVGYGGNAGDAEHIAAIAALPSMLRRSLVVALVGHDLATKDGVRAFLLGVELLVATADLPRLGELLGTALAAKRALVVLLDPAMAARLGG